MSEELIASDIIDCPCCEKGACIETKTEYISLWACQTCGYKTHSRMKIGSNTVTDYHSTLPNLIQDLHQEVNGLVWYPSIVNIEEKGMVFPDGTSTEDWAWVSAKAVEIPKEERSAFKGAMYKMDMANAKKFDRLNFMDALDHINFYKV